MISHSIIPCHRVTVRSCDEPYEEFRRAGIGACFKGKRTICEEFFQNKDEKDNSIQLNDSSILYEISPCIPSGSELFFAVTEVVEEEEEMNGIFPETRLMGMVSVDEYRSLLGENHYKL